MIITLKYMLSPAMRCHQLEKGRLLVSQGKGSVVAQLWGHRCRSFLEALHVWNISQEGLPF